ncbi:hypothetical protein TcBrA4_0080570 [Trypanosoma cruzi]|nr:hypothetical protein TcBrA4_0080570 [Trypanosoma cruzi]
MAEPGAPYGCCSWDRCPGPDRIHGEALRHLSSCGEACRSPGCSIFAHVQEPSRVIRDAGLCYSAQSGENGIQPQLPPTCNAEQLPQQAHGTHSTTRIRDVIESQLALQPSGFLRAIPPPTHCCKSGAAVHRNAPQHRTAAYFVDHSMPWHGEP